MKKKIKDKVTINYHATFKAVVGVENFYFNIDVINVMTDKRLILSLSTEPRVGFITAFKKGSNGWLNCLNNDKVSDIDGILQHDSLYYCKPMKSNDPSIKRFEIFSYNHITELFDECNDDDLTFSVSVKHAGSTGKAKLMRTRAADSKLYRRRVDILTDINKRTWYFKKYIDPNNINGSEYHVDHMISCYYGFLNDIPPEVISSLGNLQILKRKKNSSKGIKCDITIEELMERNDNINNIIFNNDEAIAA